MLSYVFNHLNILKIPKSGPLPLPKLGFVGKLSTSRIRISKILSWCIKWNFCNPCDYKKKYWIKHGKKNKLLVAKKYSCKLFIVSSLDNY